MSSASERAMAAAAHAARWKPGMLFQGVAIEGVAVTTDWRVILYLPERFIELDDEDFVLSERPRSSVVSSSSVLSPPPQPTQPSPSESEPVPSNPVRSGQQELF